MPTVVFDIRANHDTGVSRYGLNALAATGPLLAASGWRLVVVVQPRQEQRARRAVAGRPATVVCCPEEDGFVRRSAWLRQLLQDTAADLYYTSHYTVDRECPVPFVFTIHDLTRLRLPQWSYTDASFAERFGPGELALLADELVALRSWDAPVPGDGLFSRYFRAVTRHLVERAHGIVAVSEATAAEIEAMFGTRRDRLWLVPCAVDTGVFRPRRPAEVAAVRAAYRIDGPYLLFIGLTHPHKRLPWLVARLLEQRHRLPTGTRLVAVGGYAEQVTEVGQALAQAGAEDFVIFTGRVSDAELATLYTGAAALVSASLSEGSNLPPQEAMSCGCPVVVTDIPAHRETLGRHALLYPPDRADLLVGYAARALAGELAGLARSYRPVAHPVAGQRLFAALTQALRTGTDRRGERSHHLTHRSAQRWPANPPPGSQPDRSSTGPVTGQRSA
jgi:glycosyltransferase involved in cell wall biosynthesis